MIPTANARRRRNLGRGAPIRGTSGIPSAIPLRNPAQMRQVIDLQHRVRQPHSRSITKFSSAKYHTLRRSFFSSTCGIGNDGERSSIDQHARQAKHRARRARAHNAPLLGVLGMERNAQQISRHSSQQISREQPKLTQQRLAQ